MEQKLSSRFPDIYLTPESLSIFESFAQRDVQKTYLFSGSALSDKKEAAVKLAAILNCPLGGCGTCLSCQKVLKRVHPDVLELAPEGNEILIDQVRLLRETVELAPFEGRIKVVLIEGAEKFNQESGNAMLKILEEPPRNVLFLLLTEDENLVLPTIRSRAEVLRFPDVPLEIRLDRLEKEGVSREEARLILGFRGSLSEALSYFRETRAQTLRKTALSTLARLPDLKPVEILEQAGKIIDLIEEIKEGVKKKQKEELSQWKELLGEKVYYLRWLEKKHKRELRKTEFKLVSHTLLDLSLFLRDGQMTLRGMGTLINKDFQTEIRLFAQEAGEERLEKMERRVSDFKMVSRVNVDWKLLLELIYLILREDLKGETDIRRLFP